MKALVFFSDGGWVRQYLDDLARRKIARYDMFLAWLIRTGSRSRLTHVSISFRGRTLDPAYVGNRLYATELFVTGHPGLVYGVEVPITSRPNFDQFDMGVKKTPWPTVARVATFGWLTVDDCICNTTTILNQCGFYVPQHVLSPARLFDWLTTSRGCRYATF